MRCHADRRVMKDRRASRGVRPPRTLVALLVLALAAPAAACYRDVRHDIRPGSLTRLDGIQTGARVTLLDLHGRPVVFDNRNWLDFRLADGSRHKVTCAGVTITGPLLVCLNPPAEAQRFDLADMQRVQVVGREISPGKVALVGLGVLVEAVGLYFVWALVHFKPHARP